VKAAQILASKDEFLPPPWTRRLGTLWDDMPPQPWRAVRRSLLSELRRTPHAAAQTHAHAAAEGATLERVFSSVDAAPLAAASVAQVHAARLRDPPPWADDAADSSNGALTARDVVIKVQHRGMERLMGADLRNLGAVGRFLRPVLPFDIAPIVREIQDAIPKEFNFRREVRLQAAIRERLLARDTCGGAGGVAAAGKRITIPRPLPRLCARGLIVMERLAGTPLTRLVRPLPPGAPAAELAAWHAGRAAARAALPALASAYGSMLLRDGLFHGDPHPGNLLLTPQGGLALLDFGQCKALRAPLRLALAALISALARGDRPAIAAALAGAGFHFAAAGGGAAAIDDVATLGYIIFDTRRMAEAHGAHANPLVSPLLRRASLAAGGGGESGFNGGLYMVVRALTLLRSLCYALDADVSMAAAWGADADAALAAGEAGAAAADAANAALEALEESDA
jgi:predicted unusual protein kinase regulating ubiquinone biosynthesis (AarF/ABC1/UbiB family)